jgi:Asp-tRNA(Asn)/Glu-tRNA(Gln) amidotransferase C subunit
MESFVLAVAKKKAASKMVKELNDIINFCPTPRRGENYGLPSSFLVLSEGSEATSAVINQSFVEVLKKFEPFIESVHVTDQYTGIKEDYAESEAVEVPDPTAMLFCTFTGTNMKAHEALTGFALQLLDRVSRVKLSKEAKEKAVKARSKVAQSVMKLSHAQRQEAAQAKKEAKKRQDRDKLMDLEPDKARKAEAKEQKRARKKQAQKQVKMVRVG